MRVILLHAIEEDLLSVEDGGTGVAESLVPKSGRSNEVGVRGSGGGGRGQDVEVTDTIPACDHAPRL